MAIHNGYSRFYQMSKGDVGQTHVLDGELTLENDKASKKSSLFFNFIRAYVGANEQHQSHIIRHDFRM